MRFKRFANKKTRIIIVSILTIFIITYIIVTHFMYNGIGCPIHYYTGIYCFLCGTTRSTWALIDGQFEKSFNFNPFYFIFLPYMILKYIEMSYTFIKDNQIKITKDMIFLLIVAFVYMYWRNQIPSLQPLPTDSLFIQ